MQTDAAFFGDTIRDMNRYLMRLIAGLCIAMASISVAQEKTPIPLPSDPSTPIITMDWRGGYGVPHKSINPVLLIRANGRVTVTEPSGKTRNRKAALSPTEIQDLLHFAITEQEFFSFSAASVWSAIAAEEAKIGTRTNIVDAADTVLHIKTATMEHEVSYNALGFWAQQYPTIQSLGQLRAIEVRLTRLIDDVKAGRK